MIAAVAALAMYELKPGVPVPIWPAGLPIGRKDLGAETVKHDPKEGQDPVTITGNVSNPTLTLYKPSKAKDTGAAVMVCPGGGYYILATNLEGTEICEWLTSIGVTAVMLKYRVPSPNSDRYGAPLQDAQRGLGIIRSQATALGINPNRIGVLGFSAGGHLSATLSNNPLRTYPAVDDTDKVSCKPDFTVLVYPAYLAGPDNGDHVAKELNVSADTPPTFIVQTVDDPIPVTGTLIYATALAKAKVPNEVHVFPKGGHGYGLRKSKDDVSRWPGLVANWLKSGGWLSKRR